MWNVYWRVGTSYTLDTCLLLALGELFLSSPILEPNNAQGREEKGDRQSRI